MHLLLAVTLQGIKADPQSNLSNQAQAGL